METIHLSLGSNLGDKKQNLLNALSEMEKKNIRILTVSNLYETEPIGFTEQPVFYNICVEAETSLDPHDLLTEIKLIESSLGRENGVKWGPRIIDIDILFYSNIIINSEGLTIPHPEIENRAFVLLPLSRICGDFLHPVYGKSISKLLENGDFDCYIKDLGELDG